MNQIEKTDREFEIAECFSNYLLRLGSKCIFFYNDSLKKGFIKSRLDTTRYSCSGQIRIKSKIKKRLGHYYFHKAVMLTLTFNPSLVSRLDAWGIVGKEIRRVENDINQHRKRKGIRKAAAYMEVKECGENGYPHVHLVYPGLKYLADQEVIRKLWGQGHIKVNYGGSFKPASYACKYISKMGVNDVGLMFMWWHKIKLYTFSRAFEYLPEKKGEGWKVLRIEDEEGRIHFPGLESVRAFINMNCVGYSIEEGKIYEGG
ncbi:MAG: hypothetical protein ABSH06_04420 [Thermodesulfobacteriota bacterium]